jgi:hypothetical protein
LLSFTPSCQKSRRSDTMIEGSRGKPRLRHTITYKEARLRQNDYLAESKTILGKGNCKWHRLHVRQLLFQFYFAKTKLDVVVDQRTFDTSAFLLSFCYDIMYPQHQTTIINVNLVISKSLVPKNKSKLVSSLKAKLKHKRIVEYSKHILSIQFKIRNNKIKVLCNNRNV